MQSDRHQIRESFLHLLEKRRVLDDRAGYKNSRFRLIPTLFKDLTDCVGCGCEVVVFRSALDPDYVVKIQWPLIDEHPPDATDEINKARMDRKKKIYGILANQDASSRGIPVAPTFFLNDGVIWQQDRGISLASFLIRKPQIWDAVSQDFFTRLGQTRGIVQHQLHQAHEAGEMRGRSDDALSTMLKLDDHFFNFASTLR